MQPARRLFWTTGSGPYLPPVYPLGAIADHQVHARGGRGQMSHQVKSPSCSTAPGRPAHW
jgi:hypothetical protein